MGEIADPGVEIAEPLAKGRLGLPPVPQTDLIAKVSEGARSESFGEPVRVEPTVQSGENPVTDLLFRQLVEPEPTSHDLLHWTKEGQFEYKVGDERLRWEAVDELPLIRLVVRQYMAEWEGTREALTSASVLL